jgi:hypothetical protein
MVPFHPSSRDGVSGALNLNVFTNFSNLKFEIVSLLIAIFRKILVEYASMKKKK